MDHEKRTDMINELLKPHIPTMNPLKERALNEALYSCGESNMLNICYEDALRAYALVRLVLCDGFPEELWM